MKIRPKGTPNWNQYDHCVLAISVGSRNHVGPALRALVDFVNTAPYRSCLVDLSDSLHRYDFMIERGDTEAMAHAMSTALGDQWLCENKNTLDRLGIPYRVRRWDHWLNDSRFSSTLSAFHSAFSQQPAFRSAVLADAQAFFDRWARKGVFLDTPRNLRLSADYLLEELACHTLMYGDMPTPAATLYPGREQSCRRLVSASQVPGVPNGLEKSYFVRINLWDEAGAISRPAIAA